MKSRGFPGGKRFPPGLSREPLEKLPIKDILNWAAKGQVRPGLDYLRFQLRRDGSPHSACSLGFLLAAALWQGLYS